MKYILEIILILITITCFYFLMEYKRETSNLKANLNQTNSILHKYINNDTTLNKNVLTQEFKEDYYIVQQQLNQEQIVTYVSLLFGILGIIGLGIFVFILSNFKKEQRNDNITYRNEQKQLYDKQIRHQIDLGLNFANTVITSAEIQKETNQFNYVFQTLMGLANYKHYGYQTENKEQINDIILNTLIQLNRDVSELLITNQPSRNLIWTYLSELTSIRDIEIANEVNTLRSKIKDQ